MLNTSREFWRYNMTPEEVIKLYIKEREYERKAFGEYKHIKALSFPSFLLFLKDYIDRAIKSYTGPWAGPNDRPEWLNYSMELDTGLNTPSEAYANVIKIMALAGAALETYANIDVEKWRESAEKDLEKWRYEHE